MARVVVETWEAETLEEVKETGRTRPLVVSCTRPGTGPHERRAFLVKAIGAPEITVASLRNELLGCLLARELGLGAPEPALVEIAEDVAAVVNHALSSHGVRVRPGTAIGCEHVSGLVPLGARARLPEVAHAEAAAVYAFDLLVQNPDRRLDNPNCALRGGHVFPYDFEMCFSFLMAIGGGGDPCDVGKQGIHQNHLFFPLLRGESAKVDLAPFLSGLKKLTRARLDSLTAALPAGWRAGADRIRSHILAVRARMKDFEVEVQRSLR